MNENKNVIGSDLTMDVLRMFGSKQIKELNEKNEIDYLVSFVSYDGVGVVNPFLDEGGDSITDPIEYYGLEKFLEWARFAFLKIDEERNVLLNRDGVYTVQEYVYDEDKDEFISKGEKVSFLNLEQAKKWTKRVFRKTDEYYLITKSDDEAFMLWHDEI